MTNTTNTTNIGNRSPERLEFLADILSTAVEGGVNYWCEVSGYRWDDAGTARALLTRRGGDRHELTPDVIARGLGRVLAEEGFADIREANRDNDAGMIDAEGADVIVQAALFGEVVYA